MKNSPIIAVIIALCIIMTSCQKEELTTTNFVDEDVTSADYTLTDSPAAIPLPTSTTPDGSSGRIPVKVAKRTCLEGGTTLIAYHPAYADMDYFPKREYRIIWVRDHQIQGFGNTLECACGSGFEVKVLKKTDLVGYAKADARDCDD